MDNPDCITRTIPKISVGIMGGSNRKRNAVINAMIGEMIIPPASATLLRITYDMQPHAQVIRNNGSVANISVDEIAKHITPYEVSQGAETTDEVIVYHPCQLCQKGIDIVDIPFWNDDARMVRINEKIISRLDGIIMIIDPRAPLGEADWDIVCNELMGSDSGHIMFAVNDIAAIRPGEREHMVESIKKRIQTAAFSKLSETYGSEPGKKEAIKAKIEEYPFFLISASEALNARTDRDDELLAESGIQKLEDALVYMNKEADTI